MQKLCANPSGPRRRRVFLFGWLCAALVCGVVPGGAQSLQFTGGSSTLFNASGGSVNFHSGEYSGRVDLGYTSRFLGGFYLQRPLGENVIGLGDETISFGLPTDIFDSSHYFLGRGASLSHGNDDHRLFVFAGATTQGFFAPFLNVAQVDTATGILFYEAKLSSALKFYSRNAFSRRQTSIQSLEWSARRDIKLALAGGFGSNQPYGATSFSMDDKYVLLDASYALVGDAFRRVLAQTPAISEVDRENVRLELRPFSNLRIIASRNNYLSDPSGGSAERATVNGFGVWGAVHGLLLYGSVYQSTTPFGQSVADAMGARRQITSRVELGFDFLRSRFRSLPGTPALVGTVRETISPRLSLMQLITHTGGQTNVSFGGTFLSNWVTIGAEYETLFFPFATPGQPQFRQVMDVSLHFQLSHGVQLNLGTNVSPAGQIRYNAYGTSFACRQMNGSLASAVPSGAIFPNVVRGRVEDPNGEPVAGAAIRIGSQTVFTGSDGLFFARLKSPGDLPLAVVLDDFTAPGAYEVVTAPARVSAAHEDAAERYKIVVRRVSTPQPSR